jgi:imidazolonepropionase-like amidohydrolase
MISELSGRGNYALRAARGVDVTAGKVVEDAVVLVENERITGFGKGLAPPAGASVIDLGDATLLPGLHDNHCHLLMEPIDLVTVVYRWGSATKALHGLRNAQKTLWGGFTTVRDPGDSDWQNALVELRNFIAQGHAAGPRVLVAPHYLSITGGHGDANDFACDICMQPMGRIVDGVDEMRKAVREEVKLGADWIKLFASGGVLSMGDDPNHAHYTLEEIRVAAEEAHRLGKRITAHAHGAQAVKYCAEAGFDSVEHCSFIDDEGIGMMKARGIPCVPTLYVLDYLQIPENPMNLDPSIIRKAKDARGLQRDRFARIVKHGVPVVYGTDIGVFPHGENWRDFPVMVECGMAPMEAIRAATVNSARMNGIDGEVGALEEGKRADVVAVAGDPLADVRRMGDVRFVMRDGVVYRNDGGTAA